MIDFIKKYKYIILIAIGLILLIIVIAYIGGLFGGGNDTKDKSGSSIDKDTGEIVNNPKTEKETYGSNALVSIIGMNSLAQTIDLQMNPDQIQTLREDLSSKGVKSLEKYDDQLKVVNSKFNENDYRIELDLIYNSSKNPAKMYIYIANGTEFSYSLFVDNKEVYKSGKLFVN
jgi:hypothetical protein